MFGSRQPRWRSESAARVRVEPSAAHRLRESDAPRVGRIERPSRARSSSASGDGLDRCLDVIRVRHVLEGLPVSRRRPATAASSLRAATAAETRASGRRRVHEQDGTQPSTSGSCRVVCDRGTTAITALQTAAAADATLRASQQRRNPTVDASLLASVTAEPPPRGRGTHPPWGKSRPIATASPPPSPTAHLAGRLGWCRGARVRLPTRDSIAGPAPDLAQPRRST